MRSHGLIALALASTVLVATGGCTPSGQGSQAVDASRSSDSATDDVSEIGSATDDVADVVPSPSVAAIEPCPLAELAAIDMASGRLSWHYCSKAQIGDIMALDANDDLAYFADSDATADTQLIAVDASTGQERWSLTIPAMNESYHKDALYADGPFDGGGVIVLDIFDGKGTDTVGYDAKTGAEMWRVRLATQQLVTANTDQVVISIEPFFGEVGSGHGPDLTITALDRQTGLQAWTLQTGIGPVESPWGPRVTGSNVVLPQLDNGEMTTSVALDWTTGKERWRASDRILSTGAAGIGIVGEMNFETQGIIGGQVIDGSTGEVMWNVPEGLAVLPSLDEPTIYGTAAGTMTAYDATVGDERWSTPTTGTVLLARSGHVVMIDGGSVLSFAASSGKPEWQAPLIGVDPQYGLTWASSATHIFVGLPPPPMSAPTDTGPPVLATVPIGSDAGGTTDFGLQYSSICGYAQQQIFALQTPFAGFRPPTFPALDWAQFYDDQAQVARDAISSFRAAASSAPDPAGLNAALDQWESNQVQNMVDRADAARLDDGGTQFTAVEQRVLADDALRAYGLELDDDPSVSRLTCIGIFFGPDAGR
jgi:outer membrane protein assembly factor BamB